ncbi:flagellar assembly protein FliH [Pseudidiomarina insulisalsae]|uniref:Flagellar assembly protein FliH n=1 Tax=Pseudidiomarina insulisalsae TaxID=575789 RepID=A0A432YDI5_9GAMM|nr:flagellar assembly protein FliH [Pseudidiomarina insulisalsae]RUO59055.1 flagellar assembly protein FliH [Pseudidiomarina insulisalsae]
MPTFKRLMPAADARPAATDRQWQRWQWQQLDASAEAAQEPATPETRPSQRSPEADQKGYEQGYKQGQKEGYTEGKNAGYQAGHEEGYAAGKAEVIAALETQLNEERQQQLAGLGQLIANFQQALHQLDEQMGESLVQLALTVGQQLAGEALSAHPEHIVTLVRDIIQADPMLQQKPILLVHPEDYPLLQQQLADELAQHGWSLQADPSLARYGCRLVSDSGEIDASLESRWQRLLSQVRGAEHGAH